MNVIDYIIIAIILVMAIVGIKRGAIKEIIFLLTIGIITVISYAFKPFLASLLMMVFPFIKFSGELATISTLNILMYQGLAFILIFLVLLIILKIILKISGILDLFVKLTFILSVPSKIIGFFLGIIEGIFLVYVMLFVSINMPQSEKYVLGSKYGMFVLNETPVLNNVFRNGTMSASKIYKLVDEAVNSENETPDLNKDILDELYDNDIISASDIRKLKKKGKLVFSQIKKRLVEDVPKIEEKSND